jgi:alkylation response protein AidB-like acyl-CoA dehydrogenase
MGRPVMARSVYEADHEALRDSVRRFFEAEAVPHYADWDAKGAIPAAFWQAATGHGFVGLAEAGDPRFAAVVLEEAMAAGLPAVAFALATHESVAPLAGRATADASTWHEVPGAVPEGNVPGAVAGGCASGLLAGVDAGVVAQPRNGGWLLSGTAEIVVNGLGANLLLVSAETDAGSANLFAVAGNAAGLHRTPADTLLGLDALDVANLHFDAVAAEPVAGDLAAARTAHHLALAVAAMAGARTALTIAVDYVKQRKAFGRPIAEFENTQRMLAGLGARVTAVGAFVDGCLAGAATLSPDRAAAAKLVAADTLAEAVDTSLQLHGGYGYMWEYPIARAYAAARFFRLHGAADEELSGILTAAIGL